MILVAVTGWLLPDSTVCLVAGSGAPRDHGAGERDHGDADEHAGSQLVAHEQPA